MTRRGASDVPRTVAAAVRFPRDPDGEAMVLAFRPPRTTVLDILPVAGPEEAAAVLAAGAANDVTVAADLLPVGSRDPGSLSLPDRVRDLRPGAEIFAYDPDEILRFLWSYRDAHDPLALGHASDRVLFDDRRRLRDPPRFRSGRRRDRRRAIRAVRRLVLTMGAALGVEPPFPGEDDEAGAWGPGRLCGLIDASLGLCAALLHRWGSPLAVRVEAEGKPTLLRLADRRLRERMEEAGPP